MTDFTFFAFFTFFADFIPATSFAIKEPDHGGHRQHEELRLSRREPDAKAQGSSTFSGLSIIVRDLDILFVSRFYYYLLLVLY
jgi:hypothetical protein